MNPSDDVPTPIPSGERVLNRATLRRFADAARLADLNRPTMDELEAAHFGPRRLRRWCWNCDVALDYGVGLCGDCVRALLVGWILAGLAALAAWLWAWL